MKLSNPLSTHYRLLTAILLALICLGCSIGPEYSKPKIKKPNHWKGQQKALTPKKLAAISTYWTMFNDPVLTELIDRSNTNNLSLQESFLRIQEATASAGVSFSDFFPQIDATTDLATRRRSESVASAISGAENDFLSVGARLNWELDLLGRLRRLQESAQANLEATLEDYFDTQVILYSQVASTYITYCTNSARISLAKENIKNQKESLQLARELFTAGIAPELDVKQAESNLGETEATLPSLRIQLAQAKHQLAVLIGTLPEELDGLLLSNRKIPTIKKFSRKSLPLDILRQRPDIRRAERNLAAQHALIGASQAEHFPIISLPGQISFEALNNLEDAFRTNSMAYTIGPSVSWNIFNAGKISRNVEIQEARTQQLNRRYQQSVLIAVQEIENALVGIKEEKLRQLSLEKSVAASKEAVSLVKALYASGLTDFQNVLDSERRYFIQQLSLADSIGTLAQNNVALYRSLGGGWEVPLQNLKTKKTKNLSKKSKRKVIVEPHK